MATNWKIGDRIQNRWEIHKILGGPGKSGMGIVYVVYDHKLHEPFAAKTFQEEVFARNPGIAERFTQEALTWVNLDIHQNVTQARFVEKIEGKPYLFLEYVSGGDLSSWIGTPRLSEDLPQVVRFGIQFCDGMTHALSKGIKAHRDIKPQNCLVTQDSVLKVTDFGLSKAVDDASTASAGSDDVTSDPGGLLGRLFGRRRVRNENHLMRISKQADLSRTGARMGTPLYMAPEQFDDAKHVDVRADIYAFGVMLFEISVGLNPFVAYIGEELERIHKTQPPPMHYIKDRRLRTLIERCLAKDPERRFADFKEIRGQLGEIYKKLTGKPAKGPVIGSELGAAQWNDKGVNLGTLGRFEEEVDCYDEVIAINPHRVEVWSNKGVALRALGRMHDALVCYARALKINPRYENAWHNKGEVLYGLGRYEDALGCYEHVLNLNPHLEQTWNNKGLVLKALGRTKEALTCFERALELNPRLEAALHNKGNLLDSVGEQGEALDCHDRALAIDSRSEETWTSKGAALWKLGRYEEAIASYDRALKVNPRYAIAWFNKGVALCSLRQSEEALDCYGHAVELNPRLEQAWYNKGVLLQTLRQVQDSIDCYNHALALNPSNREAWENKGIALRALGRFDEASECLDRASELERM